MRIFNFKISRFSKFPKLTIESRALKYGYSNARVRGMKGSLLGTNLLNDLIRVTSIDTMIELLQRTNYKNEFAAIPLGCTGSQIIEIAVSRSFTRCVEKLLKLCPKADLPIMRALLLRWDLLNLKSLMNGRKLGADYETLKTNLFSVGLLSEDDFKRILKAEDRDLQGAISNTQLGRILFSEAVMANAFKSTASFFEKESEVDSYSYRLVDKQLTLTGGREVDDIRQILKREIDAKNILIIERMKKRGVDNSCILSNLIRGGTLKPDLLKRLIETETRDLKTVIALVKYKFPHLNIDIIDIRGNQGNQNSTGPDLVSLEVALEKSIAYQKIHAFHRAILSVGVIVGFLLLKQEEIGNLRKIAKGKEFGIAELDVRDMLVVI